MSTYSDALGAISQIRESFNDHWQSAYANLYDGDESYYESSIHRVWYTLDVVEMLNEPSLEAAPIRLANELVSQLHSMHSSLRGGHAQLHIIKTFRQHFTEVERILWNLRLIGSEPECSRILAKISEARKQLELMETALGSLQETVDRAGEINKLHSHSKAHLATIEDIAGTAEAHINAIKHSDKDARTSQDAASKAVNEISTIKGKAESYLEEVEAIETRISEIEAAFKDASDRFDASAESYEKLRDTAGKETDALHKRVKELVTLATGGSLFGAFDKRRKAQSRASWLWAWLTIGATISVIVFGIHLSGMEETGPAFWVKLSTTPLFIFLVGFCAAQYARTRRLHDEYNFKSVVSVSLEPYRDLVGRMIEQGHIDSGHVDFTVETVRSIFEPPHSIADYRSKRQSRSKSSPPNLENE